MPNFRKQHRLIKYDYSQPGYYFVTICTGNTWEYFGEVQNDHVILNEYGKIAKEAWLRTPFIYSNIKIDEYVIMPNHMHGIIIIEPGEQARGLHYSLSQIVGSYKNVVSKSIHAIGNVEFNWQPSFYDHVIRKDESLDKVREYIRNNPIKWDLDRNNTSNLWM